MDEWSLPEERPGHGRPRFGKHSRSLQQSLSGATVGCQRPGVWIRSQPVVEAHMTSEVGSRRDELLAIALEVLERDGVDNLSIGEIARQAGIKPPSLYKQFDGKADIQARLIEWGDALASEEFIVAIDSVGADATYRESIETVARAYRSFGLAHPQLYRLMMDHDALRTRLDPELENLNRARYDSIFRDALAARSFWAWAHGLLGLELARRYPADVDVDHLWSELVSTISRDA